MKGMRPVKIPKLNPDEILILSATVELPPGHLTALANHFENYLKKNKYNPVVLGLDERFEMVIMKKDQLSFDTKGDQS